MSRASMVGSRAGPRGACHRGDPPFTTPGFRGTPRGTPRHPGSRGPGRLTCARGRGGILRSMQPPRWLATAVLVALALLTLPALAGAAEPPEPERPLLRGRPQHVRDDRHRPVRHLPLRAALVRRLPRCRARRGADLLHRPALLVPERGVPVPPALRRRACATATARPVSTARQQQMAYAMWAYGRSSSPRQQAAVMLFVHGLMGDGAPGEVDPAALGPDVVALVRPDRARRGPLPRPVPAADRHAGEARGGAAGDGRHPGALRHGPRRAQPAPDADRGRRAGPARRAADQRRRRGRVAFTPATATDVRLTVKATVASTLPELFAASTPAGRPQRPAPRRADAAGAAGDRRRAGRAQPAARHLDREAEPPAGRRGQHGRRRHQERPADVEGDRRRAHPRAVPHGVRDPLRRRAGGRGLVHDLGAGHLHDAPVRLERPGWYVYQEVVPVGRRARRPDHALRRPGRALRGRDAAGRAHDRQRADDGTGRDDLRPRRGQRARRARR